MSIGMLFLLFALIAFLLDTFGVQARVNLQSLGLACVVLAMLAGQIRG